MNLTALLAIVGLSAVGYMTGKTGVKVGERIEDRRRTAVRLATWCSVNGLPSLASMLESYAVSDWSGVYANFRDVSNVVADPKLASEAVDRFLSVQLANKIATAEGREQILQFVERSLNVKIDRESIQFAPQALVKEGMNETK